MKYKFRAEGYETLGDLYRKTRSKDFGNDYRYSPDPNLVPIQIPSERLRELREEIPAVPETIRDYRNG